MKSKVISLKMKCLLAIATTVAAVASAGESVIVESRQPDGASNVAAWTELSGKWNPSKNKSRVARRESLVATNVSICATNVPVPAFQVTPRGLEVGATYRVETTFSTTASHVASPDLLVAVRVSGVTASTIPTNSPAFQGSGADAWNVLGTIVPATNSPSLTFTYVSGNLSKESRWYADAIRFTRETTPVSPAK